jgi:hypothetical protein
MNRIDRLQTHILLPSNGPITIFQPPLPPLTLQLSSPLFKMILTNISSLVCLTLCHLSHSLIAKQFNSLIRRMKNSANPVISERTGLILEYPINTFPLSSNGSSSPLSPLIQLDESLDPGHRHFSSLHWFYPGVFHPHLTSSLFSATLKTLSYKTIQSNGGHTGWSAAWETCLWSRLRKPNETINAMKKLIQNYFSRNLFGLHPKLAPSHQNCVTCYGPHPSPGDTNRRGMITTDSSIYQMDANSGMAAGLMEMLFQSHIPTVLLFLPINSPELSSGSVSGLSSRGGFKVDFQWSQNRIQKISLHIQAWHPWFLPQYEYAPGYFTTTGTEPPEKLRHGNSSPHQKNILTLVTPNEMKGISFSPLLCGEGIKLGGGEIPAHASSPLDSYTHVDVREFPCRMDFNN